MYDEHTYFNIVTFDTVMWIETEYFLPNDGLDFTWNTIHAITNTAGTKLVSFFWGFILWRRQKFPGNKLRQQQTTNPFVRFFFPFTRTGHYGCQPSQMESNTVKLNRNWE